MSIGLQFLERLTDAVGTTHVLSDPAVTAPFGRDWTGRWAATPLAVVRPATAEHVAAVVRVCYEAAVPVVPQGGNTGLVGGSVPTTSDALVLSTTRLTDHGQVDSVQRQVTVGAGMTIAEIHKLAAKHGLTYGVDLAARDTATIGGTVATNAGGIRVVHFGDTRRQVNGVEAVMPDGSVMSHLGGLPKDSAGYDISQLLVGSEGTLGVVTAVRIQLRDALTEHRSTTLVGVPTLARAFELAAEAVPTREQLLASEYFDDTGMRLVCEAAHLPHPLQDRWPFDLLIETEAVPQLPNDVDAAVERRLWVYRERQPEAALSLGRLHSLDVALPLASLDGFLAHLPELVAPHRVFTFGHLAEGNLHIQVSGPQAHDDAVSERVLNEVAGRGGSISSEHGIGRAKSAYLHLCRDAAERRSMQQVKSAIDPRGLLNPGVLFTAGTSTTATMTP
jgi:FAD/FMN-containing dehydrogenase